MLLAARDNPSVNLAGRDLGITLFAAAPAAGVPPVFLAIEFTNNHQQSWGLRPRSYDKTGLTPASALVLVLYFWSWSWSCGIGLGLSLSLGLIFLITKMRVAT